VKDKTTTSEIDLKSKSRIKKVMVVCNNDITSIERVVLLTCCYF
jgi:hypothetical protein